MDTAFASTVVFLGALILTALIRPVVARHRFWAFFLWGTFTCGVFLTHSALQHALVKNDIDQKIMKAIFEMQMRQGSPMRNFDGLGPMIESQPRTKAF